LTEYSTTLPVAAASSKVNAFDFKSTLLMLYTAAPAMLAVTVAVKSQMLCLVLLEPEELSGLPNPKVFSALA
jgi:hypothetical protein